MLLWPYYRHDWTFLPQGYHFHKFLKKFTKFYYRHKDIVLIGTIFYMQEIWSKSVFPIHVFCVSVKIWNGLYTTDSTFLAISRLTTSTHWPYYFTVHVYRNGQRARLECGRSSPNRVKPKTKIGIYCFSAKHAALRRKSKDWLAQNRDNVSEWGNMYIHGLLLQWASTIKIQLSVLV